MERQAALEEIAQIVKRMFRTGDDEGLYIGLGRRPDLLADQQEGPNVKRLRKLVAEISS